MKYRINWKQTTGTGPAASRSIVVEDKNAATYAWMHLVMDQLGGRVGTVTTECKPTEGGRWKIFDATSAWPVDEK